MNDTAGNRPARPTAHVRMLFTLWLRPRMASGFLFSFAVLLLFHLVLALFAPLPGEARFLPFFMLGPLAAMVVGPSAVWSAPAAAMMSDLLHGTWTDASWFAAAGEGLATLHVFVLWDSSFCRGRPALIPAGTWREALRFLALCMPAGFVMVVWSALGTEIVGGHTFGYVALLEGVQVLVFGPLVAPILFRVAARDFAGLFGGWRTVMGERGRGAHWRPLGLPGATAVATAMLPALMLQGLWITGDWPWEAARMGLSTGGGLAELAIGLLAVHAAFLLCPD